MACRHCKDQDRVANRPRGLCWTCYYTPGVKELYEPIGEKGVYGAYGSATPMNHRGRLPAQPTNELRGTPEKIEVMRERAARGESLFHPDDAQWGEHDSDPLPLPPNGFRMTRLREAA